MKRNRQVEQDMDPMQARTDIAPTKTASSRPERHHERRTIFASATGQPRHVLDSVRRRLILVLAFALTPIAALCFAQGIMQLRMQEQEAQRQLIHGATSAATRVEQMFALAELALHTLSDIEDVRSGGAQCAAILRGTAAGLPFAADISLFDMAGQPLCSTRALPGPLDGRGTTPLYDAQNAAQGGHTEGARARGERVDTIEKNLRLVLQPGDTPSDRFRILATLPLGPSAHASAQTLTMDINMAWMDRMLRGESEPDHAIAALLTAGGRELASGGPDGNEMLFATRPAEPPPTGLPELSAPDGRNWAYTTAPVGRDGLDVAYALPVDSLFRWSALTLAAGFALPTLIVAFSLLALWLAVDSVVLRWLLYLRRVTAVYAQGHYGFRPNRLKAAPSEFRVLGEAVAEMASAVRMRDAHLRTSLAEKTALVREVHHRIKNSLQIVVSLLSLHGAQLDKGEDRRRFEQLRLRVNTLALVHRILYEVAEGSQVHLDELLRELAGLLERASDQPLRICVEARDAPLSTDMAVPLALMMAEIVLSVAASAHKAGGQEPPRIVTLDGEARDGQLHLDVRTALEPDRPLPPLSDLAQGFASQLGGTLSSEVENGAQVVRGVFPCPCPAARA